MHEALLEKLNLPWWVKAVLKTAVPYLLKAAIAYAEKYVKGTTITFDDDLFNTITEFLKRNEILSD